MSKKPGDLSFSFTSSGKAPSSEAAPSARGSPPHRRFRILILSDFSGRTNRTLADAADLAQRKIRTVETDTLDATIAAIKPQLALPVDDKSAIPLTFASLNDFRPDALLTQIPALQTMLMLRGQLQDHKTFAQAAAVVRKLTGTKPAAAFAPETTTGESEFEKMLNRPVAPRNATQASADALIASLTAGYAVPAEPDEEELVKLVEDALSAGLRVVLRQPAFQALEAAWRGVAFLISRLNTDAEVAISILDVSKDELQADLAGREMESSALYAHLVDRARAPGSVPVSLVVGDYTFDQSPDSVALLEKIGAVMQAAGISFVAGASPRLLGMSSFPDLSRIPGGQWRPPTDLQPWNQLRASPAAAHLGMTAPRFLLRLPYGPKTDAIDAYDFDEMPGPPVHEQYLWGNGAFAIALLVGEAILENGFDGASQAGNDVSDLPCHMAMVDGSREMTPCAEAFLSDRTADLLRTLGLIPLLSVKNAAAIKVGGMSSLAKGIGLAGLS